MFVGLAHPPDESRPASRSTKPCKRAAVEGEGIHAGMGVVGVQHDQPDRVLDERIAPDQPRNPTQAQRAYEISPLHRSSSLFAPPAGRMRPSSVGVTAPTSWR